MTTEEKAKHAKKQNLISVIIIVVGVIGSFLLFGKDLFKKVEPPVAEAKKENVFVLQQEILPEELEFFGNLEAKREANLSAKITGKISSLKVNEGDWVRKGQLLAYLSPDQSAIDLRNKTEDYQNFEEYRSNQDSYWRRQVRIADENLRVKKEEREYAREHDPDREEIADDEVDKAEAELRTAKRERDAQMDSLKEQSVNLSGDRDISAQDVADNRIIAPFNGVVTKKYSEEGEVVNTSVGGLILSVADVSLYKVVVEVPDMLIDRLSTGLEASVVLDGIPGQHAAVVTLVNPKVNTVAKKIEVEVTLSSIPQNVKVNMFARVFIKFPPRAMYSVPNNFIFAGFDGPFVILEDGTHKKIQRGNEKNDETEIVFEDIADGVKIRR